MWLLRNTFQNWDKYISKYIVKSCFDFVWWVGCQVVAPVCGCCKIHNKDRTNTFLKIFTNTFPKTNIFYFFFEFVRWLGCQAVAPVCGCSAIIRFSPQARVGPHHHHPSLLWIIPLISSQGQPRDNFVQAGSSYWDTFGHFWATSVLAWCIFDSKPKHWLVSSEQGKYLEQRAPQKPSSLHQITLTAPKLQGKGFIQNSILAYVHFIPTK